MTGSSKETEKNGQSHYILGRRINEFGLIAAR